MVGRAMSRVWQQYNVEFKQVVVVMVERDLY
jgi:hypothetical protein